MPTSTGLMMRSTSSTLLRVPRFPYRGWLACSLLLAAVAGCGYQTYEERLAETSKFFAYLQRLDQNLQPAFKENVYEELRVPIQFKQIRKPAPVKNEDGETVDATPDPRQPDYMDLKEFPGLVATWEAPFNVMLDGQPATRKGYLYALSNAEALASSDPTAGPDFTKTLLATIADTLNLPPKDIGADGQRETYPRTASYTTPNDLYVYRFDPGKPTVDGVPYTIEVYVQMRKDNQACLVMVLPSGLDSQAKLSERMPLMLERLKVSDKRVAMAKKKSTGGGGAPAATGGQPPPPVGGGF